MGTSSPRTPARGFDRPAVKKAASVAGLASMTAGLSLLSVFGGASPAVAATPAECLVNTNVWTVDVNGAIAQYGPDGSWGPVIETGRKYGDIAFTSDRQLIGAPWLLHQLDFINQSTGAVERSVTVTGPAAGQNLNINSLTGMPDGTLMAGMEGNPVIYKIDPNTGNSVAYADLSSSGAGGAAGDFFQLADGDILAVMTLGNDLDQTLLVRVHRDGSSTRIGLLDWKTWGAAMTDGKIILASPNGHLYSLNVVPTSDPGDYWNTTDPNGNPILVDLGSQNREFWGATSLAESNPLCGPIAAADDSATTLQQTPVTMNTLANDSGDQLDPASVKFTTNQPAGAIVSADGLSITVPGEGKYVINPTTGNSTFTPESDFTGTSTPVNYVVADVHGQTAEAQQSVTVNPLPIAAANDRATTKQDVNVTLPTLQNDTGPALDPTSVVFTAAGQPAGSTVSADGKSITVPGEGVYTINPTTGDTTFDPEPGFTGTSAPVTYQVTDTNGQTATANQAVTVTPITPTASPDAATTPQDTPVTIPILTNDTPGSPDVPLDPTTVQLIDPTTAQPTDTVTVPGQGTWTVTPGGQVIFTPEPDFTGTTTPVDYTVKDQNGTSTGSTITVTVTPSGTNDAPPVANPDTGTTPQGVPVTVPVLTNDAPGDSPLDPTSVVFPTTGQPTGATVSNGGKTLTVPGEGTYTVNNDGTVTFTPEPGFTGTAKPITYQVSDTAGVPVTTTVTITVTPVKPTATPDTGTTTPNTPVTIPVLDNDNPGNPGVPLDPGTVQVIDPDTGQPGNEVTVPGEGVWTVTPGGDVIFTPEPGFTGTTTPIDYTVNDENGTPTGSTVTVTVDEGETTNPPGGTNDGGGGNTNPPGRTNADGSNGATTRTNADGSNGASTSRTNADGSNLAYTGANALPLAVGALALLALGGAGIAAAAVARRRHAG